MAVKNPTMQSRIKELESQIETINKKVRKLESKVTDAKEIIIEKTQIQEPKVIEADKKE